MAEKTEDVVPRFEFRAFAEEFGKVIDEIRQFSACTGIVETRDIYLITAVNETNNVKIRDNQLDIKELIDIQHGLELWRPTLKLDFPVDGQAVQDEIFPALNVPVSALPAGEMSKTDFLQNVMWPHPDVRLAQVFKRRFFFTISGCQVEITELRINGAAIKTVAIEDERDTAVLDVKKTIRLTPYENVNYLLALRRIMGMVPLSSPRWQMNEETT